MKQLLLTIGFSIAAIHAIAQQSNREQDSITRRRFQDSIKNVTDQDYKEMFAQLGISSIRQGANGSNPAAPNAANYDESKANPYPLLPDPLVLKNGKKVQSAKEWWQLRRPEIVEDFDREVYGRTPKKTPKVKWKVLSVENSQENNLPIIIKKLRGEVDNSGYSSVKVELDLTLTVPANQNKPVPVVMELAF